MSDAMDGQASPRRNRLRELEASHLWIIGLTEPARGGRTRPTDAALLPEVLRSLGDRAAGVGPMARAIRPMPDWMRMPAPDWMREWVSAGSPDGLDSAECECPGECLIDHELD